MSGLRVLVADDEPLARQVVVQLLRGDPEVVETHECPDGPSALAALRTEGFDIAFIDVEMPEMNGLDVALQAGPGAGAVVFTTAYSQYAVRAFEVAAVDYLLKPFSDARFTDALDRAKRRLRDGRAGAQPLAATAAAATPGPPARWLLRIAVADGQTTRVVPVQDLTWIEAQDYYVNLHTPARTHLMRATLANFERKLDPERFVRAHRGALVAVDKVVRVEGHERLTLVLVDGTRVDVSRSRRRAVRQALLPSVRG